MLEHHRRLFAHRSGCSCSALARRREDTLVAVCVSGQRPELRNIVIRLQTSTPATLSQLLRLDAELESGPTGGSSANRPIPSDGAGDPLEVAPARSTVRQDFELNTVLCSMKQATSTRHSDSAHGNMSCCARRLASTAPRLQQGWTRAGMARGHHNRQRTEAKTHCTSTTHGLDQPPFRITHIHSSSFAGARRGATLDALVYADPPRRSGLAKVCGRRRASGKHPRSCRWCSSSVCQTACGYSYTSAIRPRARSPAGARLRTSWRYRSPATSGGAPLSAIQSELIHDSPPGDASSR